MRKTIVDVEDFLQDEEFIQWVKKPTVETNKYWKAWMEANPDKVSVMLRARELLLSMTFSKKVPLQAEKEQMLSDIIKKLDNRQIGYRFQKKKRIDVAVVSVAASLALLISTAFYLAYWQHQSNPKTIAVQPAKSVVVKETPPGIKLQTVLPDGSKVWLNADSKVSYDQLYGQKERRIMLTGEAFFEVEEDADRPFIVQSGSLKITALGTSFNVRALAGSSSEEVALITGKVEVIKKGKDEDKVVLNPGQKVVHKDESPHLFTSEFTLENEIGWRNGLMVFDNACFPEIQETLERWYGVKIHSDLPKAEEWSYTGKFDNQSLELVLKRLAFIKGFRFKIEGNRVYLFN